MPTARRKVSLTGDPIVTQFGRELLTAKRKAGRSVGSKLAQKMKAQAKRNLKKASKRFLQGVRYQVTGNGTLLAESLAPPSVALEFGAVRAPPSSGYWAIPFDSESLKSKAEIRSSRAALRADGLNFVIRSKKGTLILFTKAPGQTGGAVRNARPIATLINSPITIQAKLGFTGLVASQVPVLATAIEDALTDPRATKS